MSWFNLAAQLNKFNGKRVYLDYAAATPVSDEVQSAMDRVKNVYANPSAIHKEGVEARNVVEAARMKIARVLKVRPEGVVFTGNGTESNNLAIEGYLRQLRNTGRDYSSMSIISTHLEHPSVTEVLKHLQTLGVKVDFVDVSEEGLIDQNHFRALLNEQTVLVSVAYVNSEIGVVQDVSKLARLIKKFNQENGMTVKFHVDAAQAPLWLPCQLDGLGVDMLSLDAGKCHGPKGVGLLAMRHGVELQGVLLGGGQESTLRSGTENTQSIVGAVEALLRAQNSHLERNESVTKLRDWLIDELLTIEGVVLNGSREHRVANNVNVSASGVDGEFTVISLDEKGFAVSTKSACSGAAGGGSRVVEAITGDAARAQSTVRITLGVDTKRSDLEKFVFAYKAHIEKVRTDQAKLTHS